MKIIELLNKIANGEEVPKKIKYDNDIYEYDYNEKNYAYFFIDHYRYLFDEEITQILDDEAEVIEDNKKIPEKIDQNDTKWEYVYSKKDNTEVITNLNILRLKINEIIDKLNEVLNDKD